MFVLTFLVGYLPMMMKLSEKHLETISVIGAGFLLGTALIVILPEGLTVLMEVKGILHESHDAQAHEHDHNHDHGNEINEQNNDPRRRFLSIYHNDYKEMNNIKFLHNHHNDVNNIDSYLHNEKHGRSLKFWGFGGDTDGNNNENDGPNRHINNDDNNEHDHNDNEAHEHEHNHDHDHEHEHQHGDEDGEEGHHHSHDPRIHAVFREMGIIVSFGMYYIV